jgi:hypothetical protein
VRVVLVVWQMVKMQVIKVVIHLLPVRLLLKIHQAQELIR